MLSEAYPGRCLTNCSVTLPKSFSVGSVAAQSCWREMPPVSGTRAEEEEGGPPHAKTRRHTSLMLPRPSTLILLAAFTELGQDPCATVRETDMPLSHSMGKLSLPS